MEQKTFDPDGVGVDNGTYFGMPFDPETAALVLVSAPWDVTVSYGAGTVYAPDAIIEASTQLDFYDPLAPDAWRCGIATADIDYSLQELSQRLRSDAEKVIEHLEGGGSPDDDYVVRKIRRVNEGCTVLNANIEAQAGRWLDAGKIVGLVGGDPLRADPRSRGPARRLRHPAHRRPLRSARRLRRVPLLARLDHVQRPA